MPAISSLLIALDLTPASDVLLHRVQWRVRRGGIHRLLLVHTLDTRILDGMASFGSGLRHELETRAREAAEQALASLAERFRAQGIADVAVDVRSGRPDVELAAAVEAANPDLVVAGSGNRLWRQAMLGSTARRLLRRLHRPLWLIRDGHDRPYARYLLACDLSPSAAAAANLAAALWPELEGHAVLVLEHLADRIAGSDDSIHGASSELRAAAITHAGEALAAFAREHLPRHIEASVVEGHPAASVLTVVNAQQPDLLVMGRRGQHGDGANLGSVVETLVNMVECDLLVVPV